MNLYPLHRPSPPAAQQQQSANTRTTPDTVYSDKEQWRQATSNHAAESLEGLRKDLLRAEARAAHWEKETRKMDMLARSAHDKLDAKKQVRKALKADLASAKEEAGKWQARYKDLAAAHITKPQAADDQRVARALKEAQDLKLAAAQASEQTLKVKLQQMESELSAHNRERPIIQERLQVGGNAFRKLQALEPKAKADEQLAHRLTEETAQLKEKLRAASQEIATLRAGAAKAQQLEVEVATLRPGAAKAKQLEVEAAALRARHAELEATKDKLRAATNEVSASAGKVQACTDMLTRAEQVLKTCSQLHAAKGESHALVRALTETTTNIAQFLQAMAKQ